MRDYTKAAIDDKFGRILGRKRIDKDKQLLRIAGVEANKDTLKAFLVGRLDTLIYDVVASLEAKPARQKDREEVITSWLTKLDNEATP